MLYSFKIVFPTRQVLLTSAVAVVKPTFNALPAEIAVPAVYSIAQAGGGNISSKLCAVSVPTVRKFSGFKFVDTALRREDFEDSCSRTSVGHLGDGHFNIMDISKI